MQSSKANEFRNLHTEKRPLFLVNVWDAASAAIVQQSGARALATSSASLAWANGYADGGRLPLSVLLNATNSILRVSKVPVTVDIENGYSDSPAEVAKLVSDLVRIGVAGINIEDGCDSPEMLGEKISFIRDLPGMDELFINARTDVYLQQLVASEKCLDETLDRLKKYRTAGADGVFVPGLSSLKDIETLAASTQAPLNLMVSPKHDNLDELVAAGVSRLSLGPAPFIDGYSTLLQTTAAAFGSDMQDTLTYDSLNKLF